MRCFPAVYLACKYTALIKRVAHRLRIQQPRLRYDGHCLPKDTKRLLANYKDVPQGITDAYERQSAVIATSLGFSRWGSAFGDEQMAAAVIDRIVHHGRLAQFRDESRRVRHALMREG